MRMPKADTANPEATLRAMLHDPQTPYWLQDTIRAGLQRDALDVAFGLTRVAAAFRERLTIIQTAQ